VYGLHCSALATTLQKPGTYKYCTTVAGDQRSVVGGGLTSLALFSGRDSG
jgi:hypothetical protein